MQRITPTHFIEVWRSEITGNQFDNKIEPIINYNPKIFPVWTRFKTIAVWLIARKKEHSQIYLQGKTK